VSGTFSPSSLTVTPGEPGIDTTTAGALLLGDNIATSIELGAPTTVSAGLLTASGGLTVVGAVTLPATSVADTALSANVALKNINNAFSVGQTITGDLILATARLLLSAAVAKIIGGATSISLRNNADSADNLLLTDAGLATLRNGLLLPAAAAGALAPNSAYATVPVKIDDQLLAAPAASITFLNPLPTGFRHLLIEWYARGDSAVTVQGIQLRFNNISTATYDFTFTRGTNNVASSGFTAAQTALVLGAIPGLNATAAYFGQGSARVQHYNGAVGNKLVVANSYMMSADTAGTDFNDQYSGKWRTTATAVTRLDLLPAAGNFVTGSLFTLWGIP
jgi:hypothetical protein